jgi:hypothetical protein
MKITISRELHNKLWALAKKRNSIYKKEREEYWAARSKNPNLGGWKWSLPFAGVLGKNKSGIVCDHVAIAPIGGCARMPRIPPKEMAKGVSTLAKKGLTPCGAYCVRDGDNIPNRSPDYWDVVSGMGHRGLETLAKSGGFILTVEYGIGIHCITSEDGERMFSSVKVAPPKKVKK